MDAICRYLSPLGGMTLASDGNALVGLWFDGQKRFGVAPDGDRAGSGDRALEQAARWLDLYFSGRDPGFTPPLAPRGSDFCQRVWRALMRVPYGRTVTYGQLAAGLHCRRPGRRRRGGPKPHRADHSLPSRAGRGRRPGRLCRRAGQESPAADAGKRGDTLNMNKAYDEGVILAVLPFYTILNLKSYHLWVSFPSWRCFIPVNVALLRLPILRIV